MERDRRGFITGLTNAGILPLAIWVLFLGSCRDTTVTRPKIDGLAPRYRAGPMPDAGVDLDDWFRHWQAPELETLVIRATGNNFTLQAATARVLAAMAEARAAGSALWPQVAVSGEGTRGESEEIDLAAAIADTAAGGGGTGDDPPQRTVLSERWRVGIAASYEVDLWGRLAQARDAAAFSARAADHRREALRTSLAAQVATEWLALITARAQRDLLKRRHQVAEALLALARQRYAAGRARPAAIEQTRAARAALAAEGHRLDRRIAVARHALAVLVGASPGTPVAKAQTLPAAPDLPATGVPIDLLRRRPDVRAAIHEVGAQSSRLAARLADRWPDLTLDAELFDQAASPQDLLSELLWRIAGSIRAVVVDGGRRQARIEAAHAERDAAMADFASTMLTALADVEDALVACRSSAQILSQIRDRRRRQERVTEDLDRRYGHGLIGAGAALKARAEALARDGDLLDARHRFLVSRIELYRALGGGWIATGDPGRADATAGTDDHPTSEREYP